MDNSKEAELKKKEAARKKRNKTLLNTAIAFGAGTLSYFGLEKGQEWVRTQGAHAGKFAAGAQILAGGALQFVGHPATTGVGMAMMFHGGTSLPREMITDENGMVKPDKASQGLAKAIMPSNSLNGIGLAGLGNLQLGQGYQYQEPAVATPTRSLLSR